MPLTPQQKLDLLESHPAIQLVYTDTNEGKERVVVITDQSADHAALKLPGQVAGLTVTTRKRPRIGTLELPLDRLTREPKDPQQAEHRRCHNEPVPGGVQIQPTNAGWVGTLGCCCRFLDRDQRQRWGILSNWHVMVSHQADLGHPQHQPLDTFPPIARVSDWQPVDPKEVNYFDAALADSLIGDFHTTSPKLLGIGDVTGPPILPTVGLAVSKSGRTTDVTKGQCTAVAAAVKVNYGSFTATFYDQAVFQANSGDFSAAGDSGSLIVADFPPRPVALLFAGGGNITIGSPIPPIADRFGLGFTFPQGGTP